MFDRVKGIQRPTVVDTPSVHCRVDSLRDVQRDKGQGQVSDRIDVSVGGTTGPAAVRTGEPAALLHLEGQCERAGHPLAQRRHDADRW